METMTLTINLPKEVGVALENKAQKSGRNAVEFVEDLVIKEIEAPSLDEILAPFRREVEASGITDGELDELFTQARREVFKAKKERLKA
jgi:hypothetical protein